MSINYQIKNLIHTTLVNKKDINLNIEYYPSQSLYDLFISDIDQYHFLDPNIIKQYQIPYGLSIVSNPTDVAERLHSYKSSYSNKIIFVHHQPSPMFKKEDLYLINKEISKYKIYTFIPDMQNKFPTSEYIRYGFNESNCHSSTSDRDIDICIISTDDNKQVNSLKSFLTKKYKSVEVILTLKQKNMADVIKTLNKTKICIDMNTPYNNLLAISCGCVSITNSLISDGKFIYSIGNINDLYSVIDNINIKYNDEYINDSKSYINSNYNYNKYKQKMTSIIENNYKLPVVL
jgi:hypothetical protein